MSKKRIDGADFMAMLADPEFIAARRRDREAHERRVAEERLAEAPLIEELRSAGIDVECAGELANRPGAHPGAVPVLLAHLPRPYPPRLREVIARALAFPGAVREWQRLKQLYRDEREELAKDGLATAIAAAATDDVIADVIALARDRAQGPSRLLLLHALERSQDPLAHAALTELSTDPDLNKEIPVILKRLERKRVGREKRPKSTRAMKPTRD